MKLCRPTVQVSESSAKKTRTAMYATTKTNLPFGSFGCDGYVIVMPKRFGSCVRCVGVSVPAAGFDQREGGGERLRSKDYATAKDRSLKAEG